ncbi:MAG: biotin--[acetyl-CoA-carboxylase] ligase [Ginsengibacter sp.]
MIEDAGPFIILDRVDSTNNYAMAQLHAGTASHATAYFAHEQLNGKGSRGKSWQTEKAKNIILSIVLDTTSLPVYQQFQLCIAISLACMDFLNRYVPLNCKIKWPNDLYWNDRKAGGLLIENIIKGDLWQWAVVGIGINVNQTNFNGLPNPVSIRQITGHYYDTVTMARQLVPFVLERFNQFKNQGGNEQLVLYNESLYKLNEHVKLKTGNVVFNTTLKGVNRQGQLNTEDVMERSFDFGKVEWDL